MLEKTLKQKESMKGKGKIDGQGEDLGEDVEEEERKMAVTALVAMIEIWMSDLWQVANHGRRLERVLTFETVLNLLQRAIAMF